VSTFALYRPGLWESSRCRLKHFTTYQKTSILYRKFLDKSPMDTNFFIKGLIIGFLIAAPVGPIGILCIRRTLTHGRLHGLASGLGAAAADTIYGFIAAFSLTFISDFLVTHQTLFRIIGAAFICTLGIRTFFSNTTRSSPGSTDAGNLAADLASTFVLTLMNPITMFAFTAVFAGFGVTHSTHTLEGLLIAGVFAGAAAWWFLLTTVAGLLHRKISSSNLLWLTRISGVVITVFGLFIFLDLLMK
jgi:threonine/homoserine/homoserine lactone efflux protein